MDSFHDLSSTHSNCFIVHGFAPIESHDSSLSDSRTTATFHSLNTVNLIKLEKLPKKEKSKTGEKKSQHLLLEIKIVAKREECFYARQP